MTRIFYDTEFLEDAKTIDLISFGAYEPESGSTFYAVSNEFDTERVAAHDWLMKNVMNSIPHTQTTSHRIGTGQPVPDLVLTPGPEVMSRAEMRDALLAWVKSLLTPWEPQAELWAWYGSYDHVALAQLFGKMIDLPDEIPMFTMDIRQLHKMLGSPPMPAQPAGLHNALADAKFNAVRYDYLGQLLKSTAFLP